MFDRFNLTNFSRYNKKVSYSVIGMIVIGCISIKVWKSFRSKYSSSEKNTVQSELIDFLSKNNQVCNKCNSLNRNIMDNPDLRCWKCDSILYQKDHPTITAD